MELKNTKGDTFYLWTNGYENPDDKIYAITDFGGRVGKLSLTGCEQLVRVDELISLREWLNKVRAGNAEEDEFSFTEPEIAFRLSPKRDKLILIIGEMRFPQWDNNIPAPGFEVGIDSGGFQKALDDLNRNIDELLYGKRPMGLCICMKE